MDIESRLKELGLVLPAVPQSVANYVPFVRIGNMVHTSGALCMWEGALKYVGKVGSEVSEADAYQAARICALNNLAVIKEACEGDFDRLERLISVSGFVNAISSFTRIPQVINGASDLFVDVLGDAGRHARTAVGAAVLPLDSAVETAVIIALKG